MELPPPGKSPGAVSPSSPPPRLSPGRSTEEPRARPVCSRKTQPPAAVQQPGAAPGGRSLPRGAPAAPFVVGVCGGEIRSAPTAQPSASPLTQPMRGRGAVTAATVTAAVWHFSPESLPGGPPVTPLRLPARWVREWHAQRHSWTGRATGSGSGRAGSRRAPTEGGLLPAEADGGAPTRGRGGPAPALHGPSASRQPDAFVGARHPVAGGTLPMCARGQGQPGCGLGQPPPRHASNVGRSTWVARPRHEGRLVGGGSWAQLYTICTRYRFARTWRFENRD